MKTLKQKNKYQVYPEYKDSGVEWAGEVPAGWKETKAKFIWKRERRPIREDDEVVTAFRDGRVTLRKNRREDGFTNSEKEIGYQGVRKNDLVIHGMDAFAGAIGVSDSNGKSTPVYSVCTPWKDANPKFHAYLLGEMSRRNYIEALARGIRERSTEFRFSEFANLLVLDPPAETQYRIAEYLDEKTKTIDAIIEKKKRLIKLLEEKRASLINHAVTKGLDPSVELVDSGIDWIGKIPKGWKMIKIKTLAQDIQSGIWGEDPEGNTGDIKCLRVADFDYKNLGFKSVNTIRNIPLSKIIQKKLDWGDVLIEKSGGGEKTPVGRAIFFDSDEEMVCANFIDRIRLVVGADSKWFTYVLASAYASKVNTKYIKQNTGIQNLDVKNYFSEFIPVPPREEQENIVKHLGQKMLMVDRITKKVQKTVKLLQEYRSGLISNVVTGKIKI